MKLLIIFILTITTLILCNKIKRDQKDLRPVPVIHIYMEHPDRDPLELKMNIEEEKREEKRIEKLKEQENEDKEKFKNIIKQQNELLIKLASQSQKSTYLLNTITNTYS